MNQQMNRRAERRRQLQNRFDLILLLVALFQATDGTAQAAEKGAKEGGGCEVHTRAKRSLGSAGSKQEPWAPPQPRLGHGPDVRLPCNPPSSPEH
ncbi:hypothetical protein CYMTET_35066 [Cymbomonas tetramitiformis]|uniref:Uncharacterized protein n=1 Tax=Cymbomonas tetramitiformis TaxID=36881 RepID=A0AAE0F9V7_9CHLO|nr:hypothetical protein CYMTET_35066 [Cymbomonas tetramitiformis]